MNGDKSYKRHKPRRESKGVVGPSSTREFQVGKILGISKNVVFLSVISILLLLLLGCSGLRNQDAPMETLNDEELAQHALMEFLENLHDGNYAEAARFYGGTYDVLIDQNPGLDPNDHAALLQNACTINGMQCLQGNIIGLDDKVSGTSYIFIVELHHDDGTLFELGPCCGSDQASSPSQSAFLFTVTSVDQNEFTVMDLPPYAP